MRNCLSVLVALLSFVAGPRINSLKKSPALEKVTEFHLPGPPGKRFDYLTIDFDDHYLILAHLGAGQTYTVDLHTSKVVATMKNTPGAEGVEHVPELKKIYTSNAGDVVKGAACGAQPSPGTGGALRVHPGTGGERQTRGVYDRVRSRAAPRTSPRGQNETDAASRQRPLG